MCASWEGFVIEQVLDLIRPAEAYFWATYQGAELDLLFSHAGRTYGIEVTCSEAPKITKSMRIATADLNPAHLWVNHPGRSRFPAEERITMWPAAALPELAAELQRE